MKKKLLAIILAATMTIGLTACGGSKNEDAAAPVSSAAPVAESEAAPEEVVEEEDTVSEIVEVPVVIVNGTGVDIAALYMSGASLEEWSDDLLGDEYLPAGTYLELILNVDQNNLAWDLSVEDSEGTALEWYNIDISEMPAEGFAIELLWDGSEGTAALIEDFSQLEGEYTAGGGEAEVSGEGEMSIADTSAALAGTVWVDTEGVVYGFEEDGITLYLAYSDGEELLEATGEYALASAEDGTTALALVVPDLEFELECVLTAINTTSLEFTDINTGDAYVLTPYVE